jgi:chemotaxis methyl-accepting protein methylase
MRKGYIMEDRHFRQLLLEFGLSWEGYRRVRKGVKKRISRHMQQLGCRHVNAYLAMLEQSKDMRQQCKRLLTVSISRFLRDREVWLTIQRDWLPQLIAMKNDPLRVWSAGCACGEEVYSFKIIWDTLKKDDSRLPQLEITATDENTTYLTKARKGVYRSSSLREVPAEWRAIYFDSKPGKNSYAIKAALKREIVWQRHNLLCESPESNFQIIFLRNNLLTYYGDELKIPAFKNVVACLAPSGLLIIGAKESLPLKSADLEPVSPFGYVFRKRSSVG